MASAKKPRKGTRAGGAAGGKGVKRATPKKGSLPKKPATRLSRDL